MRRTRPLLFVLLALLVAVVGVVVLRDPQGVAGTPAAGQSPTPAITSVPGPATTIAIRYQGACQCSVLQGGGEGPCWEGRQGPSGALMVWRC